MNEYMRFPEDIQEYPQEITETLISIIEEYMPLEDKGKIAAELENGLYYLRNCAEKAYNRDFFRVLYSVLAKISYLRA